ncbi:hypothetical protein [Pyrobaculum aerophilum]|uniref:Uncharacterized protein n=1 Tax=Pyrobaculum aerophilum TaxID=13773 RepID=A0A371QZJ4_9CREN|nr:hypothetical protein [Pyrobaculum aerophilum]RFA92825.1 hypothetical protein CGL51_13865 [Pyrobaculum aerophilum]RFA96207.1 hypothetical protein CGL52_11305 [Pyrobaculum aerophilum]
MSLSFFPEPHLIPLAIISLYLLYGALLYSFGGAHGRERAYAVWHSGMIGIALYAGALVLGYALGAVINYYASVSGVTPNCLAKFQPGNLTEIYKPAVNATQCAVDVYRRHYEAIVGSYGWLFGVSALTGILVITGPYSMGLFQAALPFSAAATSALMALGAAMAACVLTLGFTLLLPLGAIAVTSERTRNAGALLLGAGIAFPPVLAGGADVLSGVSTVYISPHQYILFGELAKVTGHVALIVAIVTVTLLVASAASYALSRVFDHAGAHIAVE